MHVRQRRASGLVDLRGVLGEEIQAIDAPETRPDASTRARSATYSEAGISLQIRREDFELGARTIGEKEEKMKRMILLVVALVLAGCGGSEFGDEIFQNTGGDGNGGETSTGGAMVGTGGSSSQSTGGFAGQDAQTEAGTGGNETGGATSDGSTGGATETGGASQGGATASSGGVAATGGATGCTLVTHDNGLGQTWEDCVPLGTYTQAQATKACEAWCAAVGCITSCWAGGACGQSVMRGEISGTDRGWDWSGINIGSAVSISSTEDSCAVIGTWN